MILFLESIFASQALQADRSKKIGNGLIFLGKLIYVSQKSAAAFHLEGIIRVF